MIDKINIIFFSSGDFGIPTLQLLLMNDVFNVKGIVTSKDKVIYNNKRIADIANENGIPYIIPRDDDELIGFISGILYGCKFLSYCVISYKKLSNEVLSLVNGRAINIHASILPYLRGAAPINWAIRLGFKQTGLTAFKLSDKIDCGDIITTTVVDIDDNDNYDRLFEKLSDKCANFTIRAFLQYIATNIGGLEINNFCQQPNIGIKSDILVAPKINAQYWNNWLCMKDNEIDRLFKSTSNGLPCKMYAVNEDDEREFYEYNVKIWNYEFVTDDGKCTDYKHYLNVPLINQKGTVLSIKEIQLEGKKRLSIEEFLRGFKYTRKSENTYKLIFSSEFIN